jgi:hypothetical protein
MRLLWLKSSFCRCTRPRTSTISSPRRCRVREPASRKGRVGVYVAGGVERTGGGGNPQPLGPQSVSVQVGRAKATCKASTRGRGRGRATYARSPAVHKRPGAPQTYRTPTRRTPPVRPGLQQESPPHPHGPWPVPGCCLTSACSPHFVQTWGAVVPVGVGCHVCPGRGGDHHGEHRAVRSTWATAPSTRACPPALGWYYCRLRRVPPPPLDPRALSFPCHTPVAPKPPNPPKYTAPLHHHHQLRCCVFQRSCTRVPAH